MYRENFGKLRWGPSNEAFWQPPTDVYETDESVIVLIEVAGLGPEDYEITLSGRTLTVSGERHAPAGKLIYHQMEIRHGRFRAQVPLPWPLESTGQSASYADGFLRITLPKAQARRVPVQVADTTDEESTQ